MAYGYKDGIAEKWGVKEVVSVFSIPCGFLPPKNTDIAETGVSRRLPAPSRGMCVWKGGEGKYSRGRGSV